MTAFTTSWIGQTLEDGRFRVVERLGEGGMAVVFKGQDLAQNQDVVIKVPKQSALEDTTSIKRFAAENRALMDLRHPHIVRILHVGERAGWPFTVLQYLPGGDLEACREQFGGKLSLLNVSQWLLKIAGALDFIHGRGYVHRDVKPGNILFDGQGQAFLGDFGVAKVVSDQASKTTKLTGTGIVLGTPNYMAPELIMDQPIDGRVDQYALGMTVYECLAGRLPFQASQPATILMMQITQEVPPLDELNPTIPPVVSQTIMQALAKNPAERFTSCTVFADRLLEAIELSRLGAASVVTVGSEPTADVVSIDTDRREAISHKSQTTDRDRKRIRRRPRPNPPSHTFTPQRQVSVWQDKRMILAAGAASLIVVLLILGVILRSFRSRDTPRLTQESSIPNIQPDSTTLTGTLSDPKDVVENALRAQNPRPPALLVAPFDSDTAHRRQQAWAAYLDTEDFVIENSIGMKFVLIPPGEFHMGSTPGQIGQVLAFDSSYKNEWGIDEQPRHRVRITEPFYFGQYEVTRGQFADFVEDQGYKTEAETDGEGGWGWNDSTQKFEGRDPKYNWKNTGFTQTDSHPVVNVTWNDAVKFCEWLSRKEGVIYRLPTDAEWEYACRAGTETLYQNGDDPEGLARVGNVRDGTAKAKFSEWNAITAPDGFVFTAPVGQYRANAFDLYDLHGNVKEWCADWHDPDYYANSPVDDPSGAALGSGRVNRGGSWAVSAGVCLSANRGGNSPSFRSYDGGFRVVRVLEGGGMAGVGAESSERSPQPPVGTLSDPKDVVENALRPQNPQKPGTLKPERPALLVAPFDSDTARRGQQAWAAYLDTEDFVVENSIGMKFVLIPPGEFHMGSTPAQIGQVLRFGSSQIKDFSDGEQPRHHVRITQPYYLGQCEVSRGQFAAFVNDTGYKTEAESDGEGSPWWNETTRNFENPNPKYNWRNTSFAQTDSHPVVNVTWNDAVKFCEWLSRNEGVTYRLPTEAEWEYAGRAGTTSLYEHGDDPEGLAAVGNVADGSAKAKWTNNQNLAYISSKDGFVFSAPVGNYRPNAFNLYDMHGNVWERCADWYDANYYNNSPINDPKGPLSGSNRVHRGGSWLATAGDSRLAGRGRNLPSFRNYSLFGRTFRRVH